MTDVKTLPATETILEAFARTTEDIFSLQELKDLLNSGKQIRIKYGVDVTSPFLHIGHAVNLWMMRLMQDHGHKVIFLIGDFTTRIGDPTGKSKTRPVISREDIERNTDEFIRQAQMVLRFDDPNLIEIRRNSEWFDPMPTHEFLQLLAMITHARLISRDMFQKRIENHSDIYMHEMIYPILQGYDSYMLDSDLTIIGSDQLFNEMLGRFYQEKCGQRPQVIITTQITPGLDGKEKQSKSLDNYIGLGHSARDKFGRTMRLPDNLMMDYFRVYTDVSTADMAQMAPLVTTDPMALKKKLAHTLVTRYHGKDVADGEQEWFEKTFSQKEIPTDIPEVSIAEKSLTAIALLKHCFGDSKSNRELRRLFEQGGIKLGETKLTDPDATITVQTDEVLQVGKRTWFKIR